MSLADVAELVIARLEAITAAEAARRAAAVRDAFDELFELAPGWQVHRRVVWKRVNEHLALLAYAPWSDRELDAFVRALPGVRMVLGNRYAGIRLKEAL